MSRLLPYETIIQATNGEPEAVNAVLAHYAGYIRYYHLAKGRFGAHRSFLALSIGLPETDVVGQAVRVGLKPLLSFLYAPDADALFSKPLHNEGCFI